MKKYLKLILFGLLALSILLTGCGVLIEPSSWPGISAYEDTVYVAYGGQVYALQLNSGNNLWRFPDEADSNIYFYAAPVLTSDGQLIVGSYSRGGTNSNNLYSLDSKNGNQEWIFDEANNRYIGSPFANEEAIFAPNANNQLYKLDLDGNLISGWSFEANDPLWAQPVSNGDILFLASMDHHVYAFNSESGRLQWPPLDLGSAIASPPTLGENGTLYVGTFGSQIVAIDSRNGKIIWKLDTEDWVWSSPTEADGKLYVGDQSSTFLIIDASSGIELWRMTADGAIIGSPLIVGENIYFATESGSVYMLEADGENDWDFKIIKQLEGRILGPLVLAGEFILIGVVDADAILVAIDYNGNQEWVFSPEN